MIKKRKLHPLDIAAKNASFDMIEYIRKRLWTMTRQEAIKRWNDIVSTVFWAEEAIANEWDAKLEAAPYMSKEEQQQFADGYCEAIATEIVSRTTDEELEIM